MVQTWDNYYRDYYYQNKDRIKEVNKESRKAANKRYYEKKKKEREELIRQKEDDALFVSGSKT